MTATAAARGTLGLGPIVASTAIPIFNELARICRSSQLALDEAVPQLRSGTTRTLRAMALRRRLFTEALAREVDRLGGRREARAEGDITECLRRARTRLKTRWHRGDDAAIAGDLYEFEMQSLRRVEAVLEHAVLPCGSRELLGRLRAELLSDCRALEAMAGMPAPRPRAPDDEDEADAAGAHLAPPSCG